MTISTEQLDELKKTHGRVVHLSDEDEGELLWEAVFRLPTKREFDAYSAKQEQGNGFKGLEQMARAIVVYPARDAFDAMLDKFPGLHVSLGKDERFVKLVGMGGASQRK